MRARAGLGFMPISLAWLQAARDQWRWRGADRPPFATPPRAGQVSVWDFPRPPAIAFDDREVVVLWGSVEVARTRRAVEVLETSHPPSWYLPWADVRRDLLQATQGSSVCEWKGPASYWSLVDGARSLPGVALDTRSRLPAPKQWRTVSLFIPVRWCAAWTVLR